MADGVSPDIASAAQGTSNPGGTPTGPDKPYDHRAGVHKVAKMINNEPQPLGNAAQREEARLTREYMERGMKKADKEEKAKEIKEAAVVAPAGNIEKPVDQPLVPNVPVVPNVPSAPEAPKG